MEAEQLALLAGILFILIAVVGGGFAIREVRIPRVPGWARVGSLLIGLAFVAPFFYARLAEPPGPGGGEAGAPAGPGVLLHGDDEPDRSRHGLRLTRVSARAARQPVRVGDTVRVSFSLQNASGARLVLDQTFVAARDPAEANKDFGHAHEGLALAANETVTSKAEIVVNSAGPWRFWPCYVLQNGVEDEAAYCPTRWRAFVVSVAE